jgi:hypothetical protein
LAIVVIVHRLFTILITPLVSSRQEDQHGSVPNKDDNLDGQNNL